MLFKNSVSVSATNGSFPPLLPALKVPGNLVSSISEPLYYSGTEMSTTFLDHFVFRVSFLITKTLKTKKRPFGRFL